MRKVLLILSVLSFIAMASLAAGCSVTTLDHYSADSAADPEDDAHDTGGDVSADTPADHPEDFRPDLPVDIVHDDPVADVPMDPPLDPPREDIMDTTEPDREMPTEVYTDSITLCEPGELRCRDGFTLQACNEAGTGWLSEECPFGCTAEDDPVRCLEFVPSNVVDGSSLCMEGLTEVVLHADTAHIMVHTDSGEITQHSGEWGDLAPLRGGGTGLINGIDFSLQAAVDLTAPLGIFSFRHFSLPAGVTMWLTGSNAAVILSCEDVSIQGTLVAGAIHITGDGIEEFRPGPGGGDAGQGPGAGHDGATGSNYTSGGGGGGSFGGTGGHGATGVQGGSSGAGGPPGAPYANELLTPLHGGSGGGRGADNGSSPTSGYGGPGGGALQISTPGSITVEAGGIVDACGWGGLTAQSSGGGGGGGSGGAILLEAHTITTHTGGIIASNGGGGGSGGGGSGTWGNAGERGRMSLEPAAGGAAVGSGCAGGNGSHAHDMDGVSPGCETYNGGGGGGGAGRIRLNAIVHSIAGETTSPALDAAESTTTTGEPARE
ncbi:MAG: hypothetical protein ABIJ56_21975 [Pseudomonadota bacterium]